MDRALEIQLTFHQAAYPAATRALRAFGTPRSRSDYLKSILEAHFQLLHAGLQQPQHGPFHVAPPRQQPSVGASGGLNEHDVASTFSQYFPT